MATPRTLRIFAGRPSVLVNSKSWRIARPDDLKLHVTELPSCVGGVKSGACYVASNAGPAVTTACAKTSAAAGTCYAKTTAVVGSVTSLANEGLHAAYDLTLAKVPTSTDGWLRGFNTAYDRLLGWVPTTGKGWVTVADNVYEATVAKVPLTWKGWRKLGTSFVKRLDKWYALSLGKL